MLNFQASPSSLFNPYYSPALKPVLDELVARLHRTFPNYHLQRKATLEAIQFVLNANVLNIHDLKQNPERFFFTFELLGLAGGGSFATALGVQYLLAGGSLLNLASPELCARYLPDIAKGNLWGCLAMTEVGHGSNVKGIETTARYEPESDQLIIDNFNWVYQNKKLQYWDDAQARHHSLTARKCWIGNSGYAHIGVVIAQLFVPHEGEWVHKGPHAFLVPMRNIVTNEPNMGVSVEDMGEKMGLNGVYNGLIRFQNVRIPRDNLMMHNIVSLSNQGVHQKLVAAPMLSLYSSIQYGRTFIAATSHSLINVNVSILMQMRDSRRLSPNAETLAKWIARTYGLHFAKKHLFQALKQGGNDTLATGMKVLTTEYAHKLLDEMRYYYTSAHSLPVLGHNLESVFKDWVASCTYEGDNPVIAQKVPGDLLISLMMMTKGFNLARDVPILWKMFNQMRPRFWGETPLLEHMQQGCWYLVLALSLKLQSGYDKALSKEEKEAHQARIWNDCQIFIIKMAHLWTALSVLEIFFQETSSHADERMRDLAEYMATCVYQEEFVQAFFHSDALKEQYAFQGTDKLTTLLKYCLSKVDGFVPTQASFKRLKQQQSECLQRLVPHFNDFEKELVGQSDFVALVRKRLFTQPENDVDIDGLMEGMRHLTVWHDFKRGAAVSESATEALFLSEPADTVHQRARL